MPAKDLYHHAVKQALINDGWTITADPYFIRYEDAELYADLAADRPLAADRQGEKIVVEIKSFIGRSQMYDFRNALGQYIVYQNLIQLTEPERSLYLAIDDITYANFFQRKSIQAILRKTQIRLVIVDIEQESIVQWIP